MKAALRLRFAYHAVLRDAAGARLLAVVLVGVLAALSVAFSTTAARPAGAQRCPLYTGTTVDCVTLVLGTPARVTIKSYRGVRLIGVPTGRAPRGQPSRQRTIRNARTTTHLVTLLNALNRGMPGATANCPRSDLLRGRFDVLVFRYSNGDRWTVYVEYRGCGSAWTHGAGGTLVGTARTGNIETAFSYLQKLLP